MHINIVPSWKFETDQGLALHSELLGLLNVIHNEHKLTAAANKLDMSYRHAWAILQQSNELFGADLVHMERGRGARLTALGQKLVQLNQRVEARLHPQLESLSTELNVELSRALADLTPALRIFASHGYAVAQVPKYCQSFQIEIHYQTPHEALLALNEGRCKIAGFHQSIGMSIPAQEARYGPLLDPERFGIIRFVKRQQGLMFHADNPHNIRDLNSLADSGARFINRQRGSGTRELLEQLLEDQQVDPRLISGFDNQEYTHSAVAAHIAADMADVGFGVQAAAERFSLGFVPILQEYYLWAYPRENQKDSDIQAFVSTLKSRALIDSINQLPGYFADHCGEFADTNWLFKQS